MAAALPHRVLISGANLRRLRQPIAARFASSSNTNSPVSFPDSDDDETPTTTTTTPAAVDKSKLPPPYNPFDKNPSYHQPSSDPSNLQKIFHDLRSDDGLKSAAVRMFDGLSKDGLKHEALELFSQITGKSVMPEVIAYTAVIEAYAGAGQPKEALRAYMRMLSGGVRPNAYTYAVLIKGLARGGKVGDAAKYMVEMVGAGMRPNAETIAAVFESFPTVEEGQDLLGKLKDKGFVLDGKAATEK